MCYSRAVYEAGYRKGWQLSYEESLKEARAEREGLSYTIVKMVDILKSMEIDPARIVEQLMLHYQLSEEEATRYIEQAEGQTVDP